MEHRIKRSAIAVAAMVFTILSIGVYSWAVQNRSLKSDKYTITTHAKENKK